MALLATLASCSSEPIPERETSTSRAEALQAQPAPAASTALEAAQRELAGYLNAIPAGEEERFGFRDRFEFGSAGLGEPYEMFSVDDSGTITPMEQWRVPVRLGNEHRALIDVESSGGGFEAYGFGAAALAHSLLSAEAAELRRGSRTKLQKRALVRSH